MKDPSWLQLGAAAPRASPVRAMTSKALPLSCAGIVPSAVLSRSNQASCDCGSESEFDVPSEAIMVWSPSPQCPFEYVVSPIHGCVMAFQPPACRKSGCAPTVAVSPEASTTFHG